MSTGAILLGADGARDFLRLTFSDVTEPSVLYPDSLEDLGGGPRDRERDLCCALCDIEDFSFNFF